MAGWVVWTAAWALACSFEVVAPAATEESVYTAETQGAGELWAWRTGYQQVCMDWENEASAERFFEQMERARRQRPNDATLLGFHAAAGLILANHGWSPLAKWQSFTKYRDQLENAIQRVPQQPDLRLIRLGVQRNAPGFLGYQGQIAEDTRRCREALRQGHWADQPAFAQFVQRTLDSPTP